MRKYEQWSGENGLALLRGWVRAGVPEAELARRMGVSAATLREWAAKNPALRDALAERGDAVDYAVEDALLRKALGYESTERKVEVSAKGERKETETVKQIGPDVSAISLWLKKRRPETWGDGGQAAPPENNLLERLDAGGDLDGIPELQPAAACDTDVVAEAGAEGL